MVVRHLVFAVLAGALAACATTPAPPAPQAIPAAWLSAPQAERVVAAAFDADGKAVEAAAARDPLHDGEVRVVDGKITRGTEPLTPAFVNVESLDVSDERREIVFSARRETSLDIGLVSLDGSHVNWVPEEPVDEVAVQWAPRGNKVSYVVRAHSGDLVRTVHIPTSYQLTVDFPWGRVTDLAWNQPAERYAVVVDSIEASPHIEVMKYDGTAREIAVAPQRRLDISIEPMGGALLLRPSNLKYGETLPLVIWLMDGDRNRWNDARARLIGDSRVGLLLTASAPDAVLREALVETKWIDRARVYVVDTRTSGAPYEPVPGEIVIRAGSTVPADHWLRSGAIIETAGSVESVAAGFIADHLKGTSSTNGHR